MMRTPVALWMALAVAAAMQMAGASPTPLAPCGPSPSMVSMKRTSISGISGAVTSL